MVLLPDLKYKVENKNYLTIAGARIVTEKIKSGIFNPSYYGDKGLLEQNEIKNQIKNIRQTHLAGLDQIEAIIKQRFAEYPNLEHVAPSPVQFNVTGDEITKYSTSDAGMVEMIGCLDIEKYQHAVQLHKENALIEVDKAKELARIELETTEKKFAMEKEMAEKKYAMEKEMAEKKYAMERDNKRKAALDDNETDQLLQNINPVLKKQRELELTQMTNENIRIKRQIEEEEAMAKMANEKAAREELRAFDARLNQALVDYASADSTTFRAMIPMLERLLAETKLAKFDTQSKRTRFINNLRTPPSKKTRETAMDMPFQAAAISAPRDGVYVLEVDHPLIKRYVGSSENIPNRIAQHQNGSGAKCIKSATSVQKIDASQLLTTRMGGETLTQWERRETLEQCYKHGINGVRGWIWTFDEHSGEQRKQIFQNVCADKDLCYSCGRGGHKGCAQKTKPDWAA